MDPVALAATIGGSAVGLAGVAATVRSSRLQQQSAREIASLQHEHERELARGGRLFERRAPVYEEMLRLLYAWMEYVDAVASFEAPLRMPYGPEPQPPERERPGEEEWQAMHVRLRTNGSGAVAEAYETFMDAVGSFFYSVGGVQHARDKKRPMREALDSMTAARANVRETLRKVERLVSDELAAL